MQERIKKRKADHIRISLERNIQARTVTTGFENVLFVHRALPEINRCDVDLSTTIFKHKFSAPIVVGAMTGGTEEATEINGVIAETVEQLGVGMGVGSQRAAIEDKTLARTFSIVRKRAPRSFLIANIGGVQFVNGFGLTEAKEAADMIEADAIAIHLNALHESLQSEGQTNFRGVTEKIRKLTEEMEIPVIAKETGAGISSEEAVNLEKVGIKGIDISGSGGTSFAAVEYYRAEGKDRLLRQKLDDVFWDWGIPTAVSLVEVSQSVSVPIIASGGIRTGVDAAKALALGSSLVSLSQPILHAAAKGAERTRTALSSFINELRNAMFLVGAESIRDLRKVPLIIVGRTAELLNSRGFNTGSYARRGLK